MPKKMRVNVYVSSSIENEIIQLADRYGVSTAYVLQSGFKICDRKLLIKLLELNEED